MGGLEENIRVQVYLVSKYRATSSIIKTLRVFYVNREEIRGLARRWQKMDSGLLSRLLSTLKT